MNEVSIFIDESGDFSPLETHAQYYIVTLIIHEQTIDISDNILKLNKAISNMGFNENHSLLSNSEHQFFGSVRDLKKNYIKPILKKEFNKALLK